MTIFVIAGAFAFIAYYGLRTLAGVETLREIRLYMGTYVKIEVAVSTAAEREKAGHAMQEALSEVGRIESVFSVFDPGSEISRINRLRAGESLEISDEVFGLIEKSLDYSAKTSGAFDITVKPLVDLWRAAKEKGRVPSQEEIEAARSKVGYQNVILDRVRRAISFAEDGMTLDFGGIAKGYAAERAAKILRDMAIKGAIVNCGGNMYVLGRRFSNRPWRIGIQDPRRRSAIFKTVTIEDKAVVTSGDYERFFMLDGRRYSHIIDPRTGDPVGDDVVSATVIADDGAAADMLATALCILGRNGLEIAKASGFDAMIIVNEAGNLREYSTAGFKDYEAN